MVMPPPPPRVDRTIPSQGNTAEIRLQVLHRNFLGVDEFLGQTSIPLADFDVYERPKNRWVHRIRGTGGGGWLVSWVSTVLSKEMMQC